MATITGRCLCETVTFEMEDSFRFFNFCHCKQCQQTSGSAHAANLFTAPDNLRWTSGEEHVKRYDVPGRAISKAFCDECGCGLPYITKSGKALIVPAGSLDRPFTSDPPQRHIFWAERASWYDSIGESGHHDEFPSS